MEDQNLKKLNEMWDVIDKMEDFIKISAIDNKMNMEVAEQLLKYAKQAKNHL